MRLVHTTTLRPHEFFAQSVPPYAILSHRWDSTEVTYQELSDGRGPQVKGWEKVTGCCAKAALDGLQYAVSWLWIDSCCIDKTSSAELSEAINSMFKWYQNAQVCYAYLSDVKSARQDPADLTSDFQKSKWFSRGWTLQELLAPDFVEFYDCQWNEIGTKISLQHEVSIATNISIQHHLDYRGASIAQKMSWASRRVTTRSEDEAYCLMGLFDVNMPILYGEGEKAFLRLQLQISSQTDDESLFAWETDGYFERRDVFHDSLPRTVEDYGVPSSIFADRVGCFAHSSEICCTTAIGSKKFVLTRRPPILTNRGLSVNFPIITGAELNKRDQALMPLNCAYNGKKSASDELIALHIRLAQDGTWERSAYKLFVVPVSLMKTKQDHHSPVSRRSYDLKNFARSGALRQTLMFSEPRIEPMYFPIVQSHNDTMKRVGFPDYVEVNLEALTTSRFNFSLRYRYIKMVDPMGHLMLANQGVYVRSDNDHLDHSSTEVERKYSRGRNTITIMAFDMVGGLSFSLITSHIYSKCLMGLIILPPDIDAGQNIDNILDHLSYEPGVTDVFSDRVSLKLTEGTYVSASLKRFKMQNDSQAIFRVEVSVDDYQRWHTSCG